MKNCDVASCSVCPSRHLSFFSGLSLDLISFIDLNKKDIRVEKGQWLFLEGEDSKGLYCVGSGIIRIENVSEKGNPFVLALVGPGGALGYHSLFLKTPHRASALALQTTEICLIPRFVIEKLMLQDPHFVERFLVQMAKDNQVMNDRFVRSHDMPISARIAEAILYFQDEIPVERNWSRQEIAEWVGTTPESVMRTLTDFEHDGLIRKEGRGIKIIDRSKLLQRASLD